MGAMAVIGQNKPDNFIHIMINNYAHETVGGMPTVAGHIDFKNIALACGYTYATIVNNYEELNKELNYAKNNRELSFIEIKCQLGSRIDLGRPTKSPLENKNQFMKLFI